MNNIELIMEESLTVKEADELRQECEKLMGEGNKNFTLNFKNCKFIDSTGLGVLVSIYKKCREMNGNLELISVNNADVLRVFKLTRLNEIFNI